MSSLIDRFFKAFGLLKHFVMSKFLNSLSHYDGGDGDHSLGASSSSIPPLPRQYYEVFLSFRGETRYGFTDHLYKRLYNAGILVFRDKEGLPVGERNWPELVKAIETSKISIPIISPDYNSSEWCLKELVHILKCKKTYGQHVIPIFYRVKPSDVRKELEFFEEEFHLCNKNRHNFDGTYVQEWKDALTEVSYMTGLESEKVTDGYEGGLVEIVVSKVLEALKKHTLVVSDDLVGVEDHVEKIINMVNVEGSSDVSAILIHGMGGVGKTTLAKVVFNHLTRCFDCCSFLANIREAWSQHKGKEGLQEQLISDVLGQKQSISTVDQGVNIIRDRFKYKKALILLDDVDHRDQLNALAGKRDWFGRGSMLIITSRMNNVLRVWEKSFSYELNGLNHDESLLLFCKHAFKGSHSVPKEFHTLAKEIVFTTGGLPLAIEVIGCHLHGEDDKDTWEKNLKKLKEIPDDEVQSKLKISFDALKLDEKQIFLDIACLSIHEEKELAFHMWDSYGFHSELVIKKLISMSLIKLTERNELIMHDQLRNLGREIVRQESINNFGERSRLWKLEEVQEVLESEKGTPNVQAISLTRDLFNIGHFKSEQFEGMTNLKFLRLKGACLEGDFQKLFLNLRWFELGVVNYAYHSIEDINFLPKKLVILCSIRDDGISEHWDGWKHIKNLKVLKLWGCHFLSMSPDFSVMKGLEVLELVTCGGLRKIHPSIGELSKTLKVLNLRDCEKLTELPTEVGKMEELRELCVDNTDIKEIPIVEGYMTKLETLSAEYCRSLSYIPDSLGSLVKLQHLLLEGCPLLTKIPESIKKLKSLTKLHLPVSIRMVSNLMSLNEQSRALNLGNLNQLNTLGIDEPYWEGIDEPHCEGIDEPHCEGIDEPHCEGIDEPNWEGIDEPYWEGIDEPYWEEEIDKTPQNISLLLELPSSLEKLWVFRCQTLQILPDLSNLKNLLILHVHTCPDLVEITNLEEARSLTELSIVGCKKLSKLTSMGTTLTTLELNSLDALENLPDLSTAEKLKSLRINNCKSLREIQGLASMEDLQLLEIMGCETLRTLPNLSNLKNLSSLRIYGCFELEEINGLEEAESLTMLEIGFCNKFSKLSSVGTAVTELRIFCLEALMSLPDLSTAKKLKKLEIECCNSLVEIKGLGGIEGLQYVRINECSSLERIDGLEEVASLTKLTLERCMLLRYSLDLSKLTNLKSLTVLDCKELPKIQGLENLRSLDHYVKDADTFGWNILLDAHLPLDEEEDGEIKELG